MQVVVNCLCVVNSQPKHDLSNILTTHILLEFHVFVHSITIFSNVSCTFDWGKNWSPKIQKVQLMAQFRIFPSSESRHSFVSNYASAVKSKIHILVLFCCMIIPLYVSESKYLKVICLVKIITISPMTHFMKVYFHTCQYLFTA